MGTNLSGVADFTKGCDAIVTIRDLPKAKSFGTKRGFLTLMKTNSLRVVCLLATIFAALYSASAQTKLNAAGSTFAALIMERWSEEFGKTNPNVQIIYLAVGSGIGVTNFMEGIVDFAASDAAMTDEQIAKVKQGVVLIPFTAGTIVLAYNLPGVDSLKLSREAYSGIFLGKITKWNDPAIAKTNEGVKLPDTAITVCERSDASGTTYVFTKHLSTISPDFKTQVGEGTTVTWPTGSPARGNGGIATLVKQTPGAIGYVEYAYAKDSNLNVAQLQNKSGAFVSATIESGTVALNTTQFPTDMLRAWPSDPDGQNAYPIATFSWLLLYKKYESREVEDALKKFVAYGLSDGQKFANELGYIPLPKDIAGKSAAALGTIE
jgi:phosphate transport system substrate-binding protein